MPGEALLCSEPPRNRLGFAVTLNGLVDNHSHPCVLVDREGHGVSLEALQDDRLTAALLSAVAGYVDAAGFLALFGLFTAHVTGDLVAAGTVIAERVTIGMGIRLLMIPVFMLSVAAASLFARAIRVER